MFLASSAVFQWRDPGRFCLIDQITGGEMWTLRDSLLVYKWIWLHGYGGEGLFLSVLLSLIQLCQNTTKPNYYEEADFGPRCLFHRCLGDGVR